MSKFVILHKKKDTLNCLCCIMKVTKQTLQHLRKKVPLANTIHHSTFIYNQLKKLNLCKSFSVLLFTPRGILPVNSNVWIAIFMQLFLAALDKIIFRDYNYNSVIYHCYIGGVQNKRKWNDFRKYPPGSESRIFRKRI